MVRSLQILLNSCMRQPGAWTQAERIIQLMLMKMGFTCDDAEEFTSRDLSYGFGGLYGNSIPSVDELYKREAILRQGLDAVLKARGGSLDDHFRVRADYFGELIRPYLEVRHNETPCGWSAGSILDLGGGTGDISRAFSEGGVLLDIADTIRRCPDSAGFIQIEDGQPVPEEDDAYEAVLLLMTAHHSDHPDFLLSEAFRLASKRVIIIESVTNTLNEFFVSCIVDWFNNRVLSFHENPEQKIKVPCMFDSTDGWKQRIFALTGMLPSVEQDLGFQTMHNTLLVYKKKR